MPCSQRVWAASTAEVRRSCFREFIRPQDLTSWLYDFGDIEGDSPTTHQTTLVEVDGDVVLQDAYFNFEYVDSRGMPIPFLDLITLIHAGVPPAAKDGVADKDWLFQSFQEAHLWVGPYKTCHSTTTEFAASRPSLFRGFLRWNPIHLIF